MSLTKCRECGNSISTEAERCPHCGSPARFALALPPRISAVELPKKKSQPHVVLGFSVIILVLAFVAIGIVRSGSGSAQDSPAYVIVDKSVIPNGGYYQVIVVNPMYRNESDMRKLAARLSFDTRRDRNAVIWIYDDRQAAMTRKAALAERLSAEETKHHDAHMIGAYDRNGSTGYHQLQLMLDGSSGTVKEIRL